MPQKELHARVLKKLKLLANYQKFANVLNKESDNLHEYKAKDKDTAEADQIRQFLKNK